VNEVSSLFFFCNSTSEQKGIRRYDVVASARHHTFSSGVSIGHMPHIHQGLPLAARSITLSQKNSCINFEIQNRRLTVLTPAAHLFIYRIYIFLFLRRRLPQNTLLRRAIITSKWAGPIKTHLHSVLLSSRYLKSRRNITRILKAIGEHSCFKTSVDCFLQLIALDLLIVPMPGRAGTTAETAFRQTKRNE